MKKKSIKMELCQEPVHRIGASRVFGNPDLPDSLLEEEGLFSTTEVFLAQIAFCELADCGEERQGMLYFFLEMGEMPYEAHVLSYSGQEPLDEAAFNEDTEAELKADISKGYSVIFSETIEETEGVRDDGGEAGIKLFGMPEKLSWGYLDRGRELLLQIDLRELPDFLGRQGGYLYFIIDKEAEKAGRFEETVLQMEFGPEHRE